MTGKRSTEDREGASRHREREGQRNSRHAVHVVSDDHWVETALRAVSDALRAVPPAGLRTTLALAGGSTPRPVYERLVDHNIPWEHLHVYFGDERCVPPDSPDSNYRMARESLLDHVPIPSAHVYRMEAEEPDRKRAADEYAATLPRTFDLLLLGIGADGHTASLFPQSAALDEYLRRVVPVDAPVEPKHRLTVTAPVIARAQNIIVLARGSAKAAAVARALEGEDDVRACPAQLARRGLWILDHAAAARLKRSVG